METTTHGVHQGTYDAVFQHPISRNLQWRDLRAMLSSLAVESEENNGNFKFVRNGQTITIHPPQHKDFSDIDELMKVRHFLDRSKDAVPAEAVGADFLVVIDHREALIYKTELQGTTPIRIAPFDPHGYHRNLRNVENDSDGQRKPELRSFYEAIAKGLAGAEKILILGSATGASSAMDHLVEELKKHHAEIAKRIVGTVVVNEQHLTEGQLLAEARSFYAGKPA